MRVGKIMSVSCTRCSFTSKKFIKTDEEGLEYPCPICTSPMKVHQGEKPTVKCFTPYYNRQLDQKFYTRDEERSYVKKNGLYDITGEHKAWRSGRGGWKNKAG